MNIRQGIIPASNSNRPGTGLNTQFGVWITVHETANTDVGADAEMHRRFTDEQEGGSELVSFHFVVDDQEAIQLLPLDEIGWHAGDGCDEYPDGVGHDDLGCFSSIAIETCVNSDGDWSKTFENLAELIATIIDGSTELEWGDGRAQNKITALRVAQHNAWSGKDCPHKIRANGLWPKLIANVNQKLSASSPKWVTPLPIPAWDGTDKKQGGTDWIAMNRVVTLAGETIPRAWASSNKDDAKAGEAWKEGTAFKTYYIVQNGSKQWWYVTQDGFRILMSKCKEQFRPFKRAK